MNRILSNLLRLGLILLTTAGFSGFVSAELKVGDAAPKFALPGTISPTHELTAADGSWVVVAWFPKAYTSGCTIECKSLAENGHLLREYNVRYYMASVDPLADNIGFAAQQQADFPLLSDVSKEVAQAFGVLSSGGYAKRYTFLHEWERQNRGVDRRYSPARRLGTWQQPYRV